MFLVIEIQKGENGSLSWLVTQHEDIRDADSKYYAVLSAAAKSGLERHSAALLHEDGHCIRSGSYRSDGED